MGMVSLFEQSLLICKLNFYFMKRALGIILLFVIVFSCKKNESDGIAPEDKEKAAAMTTFLQANQFRLAKYYSETPIDYIDTDQVVKAETDLWQYVSTWLHDDSYVFGADGNLTINQNAVKIPSNGSGTISKHYAVQADKEGVSFDFVGHQYQDLRYRLISFNDTMVKVSATWNGKTVISEYNKISQ
jgi:hypothetical protein